LSHELLQEGDIIELKAEHCIYADVPKHFVYANKRGEFDLTHTDIQIGTRFDYFIGRYVVYKTCHDGSGMMDQMMHSGGHHVFCQGLDGKRYRVDFYQTGGFTAVNPDIRAIGRAELSYTEQEPVAR
jgi:hypothetical protein